MKKIGVGLVLGTLAIMGCAAETAEPEQDLVSTSEDALCAAKPPVYVGSFGGYATYSNGCYYYQKACTYPARVEYTRIVGRTSSGSFYDCSPLTGCSWKQTGSCR